MEQQDQRPSRHVCLTRRAPLGISSDPELDMLQALADPDVLTMVRGLAREEARSPFPDGLFGLDSPRTNAEIRRMRDAGLISSRRDGNDHVYFLNAPRFRDLEHFISGLIAKDRSRLEPAELEVLDPVPPDQTEEDLLLHAARETHGPGYLRPHPEAVLRHRMHQVTGVRVVW